MTRAAGWQTQCCIEWLQAKYGTSLRIGLIGHSLGSDTILRMRGDYPKVFLAGPCNAADGTMHVAGLKVPSDWTTVAPGASTEPACLILGSKTDPLVPHLKTPETVGRPNAEFLTLEQCTSGTVPKAAQYAFPVLDHSGYCHPIGSADGDARANRLTVPVVVKFCEQWVKTTSA